MSAAIRLHDMLHRTAPTDAEMLDLALRIDVRPRIARRAYQGIPVAAPAHFALCLACGFDPIWERRCRRVAEPLVLLWDAVRGGFAIRVISRLSQRAAARAANVSNATISRLESGKPISAESLISILRWIGWPASAVMAPRSWNCFTFNTHCNSRAAA